MNDIHIRRNTHVLTVHMVEEWSITKKYLGGREKTFQEHTTCSTRIKPKTTRE